MIRFYLSDGREIVADVLADEVHLIREEGRRWLTCADGTSIRLAHVSAFQPVPADPEQPKAGHGHPAMVTDGSGDVWKRQPNGGYRLYIDGGEKVEYGPGEVPYFRTYENIVSTYGLQS